MTDDNTLGEAAANTSKTRPLNAHIWERHPEDFYIEPEWCSRRLFEEEPFEGAIYDPACGLGRIVVSAQQAGLQAYGSDIVYRGWDSKPQDFLAHRDSHDNIVTNVPFKIVRPFIEHALRLTRHKVATILPQARLNAARWLQQTPLARVYLLTPRPSMPPGRVILAGEKPKGDKRDFCWLVFEHGHVGDPGMRFARTIIGEFEIDLFHNGRLWESSVWRQSSFFGPSKFCHTTLEQAVQAALDKVALEGGGSAA